MRTKLNEAVAYLRKGARDAAFESNRVRLDGYADAIEQLAAVPYKLEPGIVVGDRMFLGWAFKNSEGEWIKAYDVRKVFPAPYLAGDPKSFRIWRKVKR